MDLEEIVKKNRSYRRFHQDYTIPQKTLKELVELARHVPSGKNVQPLRYILSAEPKRNAAIFDTLAWAGALKDWPGPEEGERPSAYIVVLSDIKIHGLQEVDAGIAMQTILLGAVEKGLGGCMFGSIKKKALAEVLSIPEQYKVLYVVALGKPKETVMIEEFEDGGDIRYYRDGNAVHHVPKRRLEDILLG